MESDLLLRGLVIGFSIAAPVGPIGVLCIRRTLDEGSRAGLLTGLGAATADAVYGSIAGFGLVFASNVLISQRTWLHLFGGLFLCYLGVKTFLARPAEEAVSIKRYASTGAYVSTFFLTLTNPMTILSFAAIFAGLGLGTQADNNASAIALVLGVFLGSAVWWFILSGAVSLLRTKFNSHRMRWVNRMSGLIITGFGILALLTLGT